MIVTSTAYVTMVRAVIRLRNLVPIITAQTIIRAIISHDSYQALLM